MTTATLRLIVAFLGGLVLVSVAPAFPHVVPTVTAWWQSLSPEEQQLVLASAFMAWLLVRLYREPAPGRTAPPSTAFSSRHLAPARPQGQAMAVDHHTLAGRLRAGARNGDRVAVLARRYGLSRDAVRAALASSSAEAPGSSCRPRNALMPGSAPAALPPRRRSPYPAMA